MLFRKALYRRFRAAKSYPVILIAGPAGSGKTTLVSQSISLENIRAAWYSLDKEDNEPDLFFRYLLSTFARADEQLDKAFSPILKFQQKLTTENVISQIITPLYAISQDVHLVLDNFDQITNEKIHDALARLIQYIPDRLHLVLLTRHTLPRPMDAAILKKEHLKLTASYLKFTQKETAELYQKVIPLSFTRRQIKELHQYMEGWAAGLQLVGLVVSSKSPVTDLSSILNQAHNQISSYLIHDILRVQPEKIRNFIFTTAILDRFNPELCTKVTGTTDAAPILERLMHMNLFLIPLDPRRQWYRYHHIFSEVIRRQVAILDPELISATLRKAATWLAHNSHLEDALRCAVRSNDFEFAAELMEDFITDYIETFDISSGLRWISKLPESVLKQRPLLRLQQCCFHSALMEFSEVKEILSCIEKSGESDYSRYSDEKQALCRDYTAYLKCTLHVLYAGETSGVTQFQMLRNKILPRNPLLVGSIETQIVFTLISKGNLALAEAFFSKLSQIPTANSTHLMLKEIYHTKIKILIMQHRGRLHQAETMVIQVMQFLTRQGYDNRPIAFLLHRHLGNIYYLQNRLEEARWCADRMVKYHESECFGLMDQVTAGDELQIQLHRAAGEYEPAVKRIRRIQAFFIKLGMPRIAAGADACIAQVAMDQNNLAAAEVWSKRRNLSPDEPFSLLFAMECLTQAKLHLAQERYHQALQLLETLKQRCIKRTLGELLLKIDILQAAALHALNQKTAAVSLLKEALAFAETEGYLRPFIDDSELITPILRKIAAEAPHTLSTAYLEKLFAACDIFVIRPAIQKHCEIKKQEELTLREIQILEWMAQGLRNKDIAGRGCIAITTVKSHVSSILDKLNVKNRTQAVLKAREMNLLNTA